MKLKKKLKRKTHSTERMKLERTLNPSSSVHPYQRICEQQTYYQSTTNYQRIIIITITTIIIIANHEHIQPTWKKRSSKIDASCYETGVACTDHKAPITDPTDKVACYQASPMASLSHSNATS